MLALSLLAGCSKGSSTPNVVGKWTANVAKSKMSSTEMTEEVRKLNEALVSSMALEVRADNTFTLKIMVDMKGTWTLNGNKLILTPDKEAGQTISFGGKDAMDFVVAPDGKSMTFTSSDPKKPGELVMDKVP